MTTPEQPFEGDIREAEEGGRETYVEGRGWVAEECTCHLGESGYDNCVFHFPVTWPR